MCFFYAFTVAKIGIIFHSSKSFGEKVRHPPGCLYLADCICNCMAVTKVGIDGMVTIMVPNRHSTNVRAKVKTIQLFLG